VKTLNSPEPRTSFWCVARLPISVRRPPSRLPTRRARAAAIRRRSSLMSARASLRIVVLRAPRRIAPGRPRARAALAVARKRGFWRLATPICKRSARGPRGGRARRARCLGAAARASPRSHRPIHAPCVRGRPQAAGWVARWLRPREPAKGEQNAVGTAPRSTSTRPPRRGRAAVLAARGHLRYVVAPARRPCAAASARRQHGPALRTAVSKPNAPNVSRASVRLPATKSRRPREAPKPRARASTVSYGVGRGLPRALPPMLVFRGFADKIVVVS